MRNYSYSRRIFLFRNLLLLSITILFSVAILRPAWGLKESTIETNGTDIVFTLDVSKSMQALDMSQGSKKLDRLSMAKIMIENFVTEFPQNRYGLVIFAGEAFVSTPLTMDHSAFLTFLNGVSSKDIAKQGTDLGEALKASIDRFYSGQDKERGRSIVLISDGGEEMNDNIDDFAKVAKNIGISIFTVGIGSTKGVPIPDSTDFFGRVSYKTYKGKRVLTKLNEDTLKEIAKKTNGEYFHAKKRDDLQKISKGLAKLNSTTIKSKQKTGLEDRYQLFLLIALILFLLFIFSELSSMPQKIKSKIKNKFVQYLKLSILCLMVFSLSACSENKLSFRYYNSKGVEDFNKSYYKEAQDKFEKASQASSKNKYISENNYALADYSLEEYENAVDRLESATKNYCQDNNTQYCDQLFYNLGNALYRQGELEEKNAITLWEKAIKSYKKSLEINNIDQEAQENIDFILKKIKQKKEQKQNDKKSQDGENQKDKNSKQADDASSSDESKQKEGKGGQEQASKQDSKSDANQSKEGEASKQDKQADDASSSDESKQKEGKGGQEQASKQDKKDSKSDTSQGKEGEASENGAQGEQSKDGIDKETNQKLEKYMQQLEEQNRQNQKYLNQNPKANKNSDDFFDDPFFHEFFGNNSPNMGFKNENSNKIDW